MKKSVGKFSSWPSIESTQTDRFIKDAELIDSVKILYAKYVEDPVYAWFNKNGHRYCIKDIKYKMQM